MGERCTCQTWSGSDRLTRTCLRVESEDSDLGEDIEGDEPDVREVHEGPPLQPSKLRRDERGAHRADAIYGVHDAHLGGGVFGQARDERVRSCVLRNDSLGQAAVAETSETNETRPTRNALLKPANR